MTDQPDNPLPGQVIDLPLPPAVTEAFGYQGSARYVMFSHSPIGDQAVYDDGRSSGTAATWALLAYRKHRSVAPLLAEFNLGYSDAEAEHALVIDREENRASIADYGEARGFVESQHAPIPPLTPEQEEAIRQKFQEMLNPAWYESRLDPAEIQRTMLEQRGRMRRMMAWLDQCPPPPQEGRGAWG